MTPSVPLWHGLTRLGEAQLLLPAMLLAVLWLLRQSGAGRLAAGWLLSTLVAAALTTASKVAFIGYGWGWAPLDFTGISGHAMFAAAILPPLARLAEGALPGRWRGWGLAAGCALAALVGVSRVMVGAHSWSEVLGGLALGGAASAAALAAGHLPRLPLARWAPLALCAGLAFGMNQAPASTTHDWVTRLALASSGRPMPYQRWQMHRDFRRQAAAGSMQPR